MKIFNAIIVLTALISFCGCGGRDPKPIAIYQPNDLSLDCAQLSEQMIKVRSQALKLFPQADKGVSNGAWAIGGAFLIVPYFAVDLKDADRVEFNASRERFNYLLGIAQDKGCDTKNFAQIPTLTELKNSAKK